MGHSGSCRVKIGSKVGSMWVKSGSHVGSEHLDVKSRESRESRVFLERNCGSGASKFFGASEWLLAKWCCMKSVGIVGFPHH